MLDWLTVHGFSDITHVCGPTGNPLFMYILLEVLNQSIVADRVNIVQLQTLVDTLDLHFHLTLTGSTSGGLCYMPTMILVEESMVIGIPSVVFVDEGRPDRLFTELLVDIQELPLVAIFARELLNRIRV